MPQATEYAGTDLIPRRLFFGNPDRAVVRVSPDGSKLAFIAPVEGVLNVWVGPLYAPDEARPVTRDTRRGIRQYFWTYTNDAIVYLQDRDGDEDWHLYRVDLNSGEILDLTPLEGIHATVQGVSHRHPEEVLVGLNDRDKRFHDLYRVHIATGDRHLLLRNDEYAAFVTDDDYAVRAGVVFTPDATAVVYRFGEDGARDPLITIGPEDAMTTNPIGTDKTGTVIYLLDSRGRDTAALVTADLATGETSVLAEDPVADIADVLMHPTERTLQAYAVNHTKTEWHALDPCVAADLQRLREVSDGELSIDGRTLDDMLWTVSYNEDDGPLRYYLYDRRLGTVQYLFSNRRELEGLPLATMRPVVIQARDGLELVSYLTLPRGTDADGDGLPDSALPLVLLVHGGPWSRDVWGYHPIHQWLANRGYAVLSVNYRGSTGFGKAFVNASNREWAGRMHDDLVDAVQWAVAAGVADPSRVAIMGGSYGGYATLVALTFTPDLFACGVDIVGPSSLLTLIENVPEYWVPMLPLLTDRIGDPTTPEGRELLLERSPLTYVERIRRPLLIGQGANDPRVKQQESDQIVKAMQDKGIPVTYVLYPDEGHGFARPENRLSFFAVTEAFLAEYLGGRVEPIGDDFSGSTIECPAGAEGVSGLAEALSAVP